MKKIRYKSILLVLCLSMFSGALSLGFVRAVVPDGNCCYLTETIVVFDQKISNWDNPAVETITIPDLPIISVEMFLQAYCDIKGKYLRAIHFDVDGALGPPPRAGVGGAINCWRLSGSQVRGDPSGPQPDGTINHGQTKTFSIDMTQASFANPPEGPYGSWYPWNPGPGRFTHNFIPQGPGDILGYFSPGVHTITSFVSTQDAFGGVDSWVTVILTFTYKFIPATIDFDPDTLNPKSQGNWVTVYIEFPECDDCSVSDIDINTILLNGVFPAEDHPTSIDDGVLMVKFDRQALIESLMPGESKDMIISGELYDGTPFEGKDLIDVLL
ncbi:hypothetical protein ES705_14300 [subsurface metagenome]